MNTTKVLLLILILFFGACNSSKQTSKTELTETKKDQIIFLLFSIEHKNSEKTIELTDKILSDGTIKMRPHKTTSLKQGDLKCLFLNKAGEQIFEKTVSDPLKRSMEYFDKNGKGAIKEIILKENTFHIRVQLQSEMYSIKIMEFVSKDKLNKLATIVL